MAARAKEISAAPTQTVYLGLSDPKIQSVMEPGGLWWTEVEINKAKYDKTLSTSELVDLTTYRDALATFIVPRHYDNQLILVGKFEPPGTPVFGRP